MCVWGRGGRGQTEAETGEREDMNEREWGRGRREENGGQTQQREGGAIFGGEG